MKNSNGRLFVTKHDQQVTEHSEAHTIVDLNNADHRCDPYLSDHPVRSKYQEKPLVVNNADELANNRFVLSPHFTLQELTESSTAKLMEIENYPDRDALENLHRLTKELLEPVRIAWSMPIAVTSGYRCPELNRAVGGSKTSQHLLGQAADIVTLSGDTLRCRHDSGSGAYSPSADTPARKLSRQLQTSKSRIALMRELFTLIAQGSYTDAWGKAHSFSFDQLIWERGGKWIHISYISHNYNRNQIFSSPRPGVYEGIAHNWQKVIYK